MDFIYLLPLCDVPFDAVLCHLTCCGLHDIYNVFIFIRRGRIGFSSFCLLVGGVTAGGALLHLSTVLQSCIYFVLVEINLCDKSSPSVCCLCIGGSGLYSFGEILHGTTYIL